MAKTTITPTEQVSGFIASSTHPMTNVMQVLRQAILETAADIKEHIKWNAPAFYYDGEMASFSAKGYGRDIVVYHVRKPGEILLVFPSGAKVNDTTGILEGSYADGRRMVPITGMDDFTNKKEALQSVIRQWLSLIER